MTSEFDLERLGAYVDGELDESEARKIEDAMARSPALRETVRALHEINGVVRAAVNAPLQAPVPERLLDAIDGTSEVRRSQAISVRAPWMRVGLAIAASLVLFLAGMLGGYLAAGLRVENEIARIDAARAADRAVIERAVNNVLESQVSGTEVAWENPDSGSSGTVTPIRTYRSEANKWCREYSLVVSRIDGSGETRREVACREPDRGWIKRADLFLDS